ncbi:hypothetical protein [Georhizobium sp. MAB10]|uniref:hypothetical protein n=1 Tax=Georhizobium sp. MAB10 TaxID=3028319 RepID=UPI003855DCD2
MTAKKDQIEILKYLHQRLASGDERYCTISTIRKNTGLEHPSQYILALTDDLEAAGLVITRQAYQMAGGKLFQITAAGYDAVEQGNVSISFDSSAWTGRINLSDSQKAEIQKILGEIRAIVEGSKLSNAQTANAIALIEAAETLIETPDPLWPEILRLLRSPILGNVTGVGSLLMGIVAMLMAAANS